MIFLYTINNRDVFLLAPPHHSGFVMKWLHHPGKARRNVPFGPLPLLMPALRGKFARNPSGLRLGWTDHVSYSPVPTAPLWETRSLRLWVTTARRGAHSHCGQVLIALQHEKQNNRSAIEENKINKKHKVVVVAKLTNHGSNGPLPSDVTLRAYKSEKHRSLASYCNFIVE